MRKFKFHSTDVRPLSPVDVSVAAPPPSRATISRAQESRHQATDLDLEAARWDATRQPFDKLNHLYCELRPKVHVTWCMRNDGSKYWRLDDGTEVLLEQAEKIISDRIAELGLSQDLLQEQS